MSSITETSSTPMDTSPDVYTLPEEIIVGDRSALMLKVLEDRPGCFPPDCKLQGVLDVLKNHFKVKGNNATIAKLRESLRKGTFNLPHLNTTAKRKVGLIPRTSSFDIRQAANRKSAKFISNGLAAPLPMNAKPSDFNTKAEFIRVFGDDVDYAHICELYDSLESNKENDDFESAAKTQKELRDAVQIVIDEFVVKAVRDQTNKTLGFKGQEVTSTTETQHAARQRAWDDTYRKCLTKRRDLQSKFGRTESGGLLSPKLCLREAERNEKDRIHIRTRKRRWQDVKTEAKQVYDKTITNANAKIASINERQQTLDGTKTRDKEYIATQNILKTLADNGARCCRLKKQKAA